MPANELNFRKKQYVQELNGFIGLKKAYSGASGQRSELMDGSKSETEKLSSTWRSSLRLCLFSSPCVLAGHQKRTERQCGLGWCRHSPVTSCTTPAGMNTTELMQMGRQQIKETDTSLLRSEKIVNDTMAIGIQTAETLQGQTRQLEKVAFIGGRGGGCGVFG